jgi:hypothetical protein
VPGTGLQVSTICAANLSSSLTVKVLSGASDFDFRGDLEVTGGGAAYVVTNGTKQYLAPNYTQLSWTSHAGTFSAAAIGIETPGAITAHVLVVRDGKTFVVDAYIALSATSCTVQAQVTPSA